MNAQLSKILVSLFCLLLTFTGFAQKDNNVTAKSEENYVSLDAPRKVSKKSEKPGPDAVLFGETLSKQLDKISGIQLYKLSNYLSEHPDQGKTLEDFTVLDQQEIGAEKQNEIAALLTSSEPYLEDKNMKNLCLFLPDLGVGITVDGEPVNALISLDCKMVRFYFQDEEVDNLFVELNLKQSFDGFEKLHNEYFKKPRIIKEKKFAQKKEATKKENQVKDLASMTAQPLYYTVKRGQGFSHVAKRVSIQFDREITMEEICKLNGLDLKESVLKTGQKLIVGYAE